MFLTMVKITKTFGIILIILGFTSYLYIRQSSISALLPALLGITLIMLSKSAGSQVYFKKSMQASVLLAFLGFIGAGLRVTEVILNKGPVSLYFLFITQIIMTIVCAIYIGLAVKYHFEDRMKNK